MPGEPLLSRGDTPRVLWEDAGQGLRIVASSRLSPDFVARIEATLFGGSGLRYRRLGAADQLARVPNPVFLELRHEKTLVATYLLSEQRLALAGGEATGIYRGLLTVAEPARGAALGKKLAGTALDWIGKEAEAQGRRVLSYGCIERSNDRSRTLLASLGAAGLGTLETSNVYRQAPRALLEIDRLGKQDHAAVTAALQASQADCGIRSEMGGSGVFYAVTRGESILAGARAHVTRVDMERIGGLWDAFSHHVLRRIPAARRRFDPRNFTYLRLSDVVAAPGSERVWSPFLTTLMAEHGVHMALFMLDPESEVYGRIRDAGLFGRFARSTRQQVVVLARAWHLDEEELAALGRKPLAIGPTDL